MDKRNVRKLAHVTFSYYFRLGVYLKRHYFTNSQTVIRVASPIVGHPVLTSSFTKYKFLQVKNSFATIVN